MRIREPWDGRLGTAMPVASGLILANIFAVFLLAILVVAGMEFATTFEGSNRGQLYGGAYLDRFDMRLRA
jgi:hypothetical protein